MNQETIQMFFHKSQMEKIKKEVKEVTYIAHEQKGTAYFIVVKLKNDVGSKDVVTFPLQTIPSQLTSKEYDFILNTLKEKGYGN